MRTDEELLKEAEDYRQEYLKVEDLLLRSLYMQAYKTLLWASGMTVAEAEEKGKELQAEKRKAPRTIGLGPGQIR